MIHVFDIDGTLLDSMPMWNAFPVAILARHGIVIEPGRAQEDLFKKIDPLTTAECAAWLCETYINPRGTLPGDAQRTPEEQLAEMMEYLSLQYAEKLQPFADTLDTVRGLREAGERVVVFSSTDIPLLRLAFTRLGILDWFDAIYDTPSIGYSKVSPMSFAEVAKREGVEPESLIVYEDTDFAIAAATLAGCLVINCAHEV